MCLGTVEKISRNSFVLKIDGFLDVLARGELDAYSSVFLYQGACWCINLYKYEAEGVGPLIRFQPCSVKKPQNCEYSYSFLIPDRSGGSYWRFCNHWGDSHDLRPGDLARDIEEIAPEGVLSVLLTFDSPDRTVLQPSESLQSLSRDFETLFRTGGGDTTIRVGNVHFSAHSLILKARCPNLASTAQFGVMTECLPNNFKKFLLYLYTGNAEVVTTSSVVDLYKLSVHYEVDELADACVRFMIDDLKVESFVDYLTLKLEMDVQRLKGPLSRFFDENLERIIDTEAWRAFSRANPLIGDRMLTDAMENLESD